MADERVADIFREVHKRGKDEWNNEIVDAMMNAPQINPTKGPAIAMYVNPDKMEAGDRSFDETRLDYTDPVTKTEYAWLSDKDAKIRDTNGKLPGTLGEYMKHDKLFEKYPRLKDVKVEFTNGKNPISGSDSGYDKETDTITLGSRYDLPVALHETQHAIQAAEGWDKYNDVPSRLKSRMAMESMDPDKESLFFEDPAYTNQGPEMQAAVVNTIASKGLPKNYGHADLVKAITAERSGNPFPVGTKAYKLFEKDIDKGKIKLPIVPPVEYTPNSAYAKAFDIAGNDGMIDDAVLNDYPGGPEKFLQDKVKEYLDKNAYKLDGPSIKKPRTINFGF